MSSFHGRSGTKCLGLPQGFAEEDAPAEAVAVKSRRSTYRDRHRDVCYSARQMVQAIGLDELRSAGKIVPVYALGGITAANSQACIGVGAVGIAAITLFQH